MVTQHGFAFPGRRYRPRVKGLIQAPETYPDVTDGTDPETGAYEVPPCPPLDGHRSRYWVGVELDVWVWLADGMHVPDGRGVLDDLRAAIEEMKRRGARVAYLPGSWGCPDRGRRDYRSPLTDLMTAHP